METLIDERANGNRHDGGPDDPEAEPSQERLDPDRAQEAVALSGPTAVEGLARAPWDDPRPLLDDQIRTTFIDGNYAGFDHMGG